MHPGTSRYTRRGVVLSDLHLFSRRSQGVDCVRSMRPALASAEVLVLNGDIFDFRWSTLRGLETTAAAALDWLRGLAEGFPNCRIHYVLGNHDCLALFRERLAALAVALPRLQWHEHALRLGSALFLHGDCADGEMDASRLRQHRKPWENDRQRGGFAATAYLVADRFGLTRFTQARYFPRRQTVERIAYYLDRTSPGWRSDLRDCYFGHTHLPFSDYEHHGVAFHNTGSAIRGMDFHPIVFELATEPGVARDLSNH